MILDLFIPHPPQSHLFAKQTTETVCDGHSIQPAVINLQFPRLAVFDLGEGSMPHSDREGNINRIRTRSKTIKSLSELPFQFKKKI